MSRYRIRGRRSGVTPPLDDEDLLYEEFTDYSEDEVDGLQRQVTDSDSDISYERGEMMLLSLKQSMFARHFCLHTELHGHM